MGTESRRCRSGKVLTSLNGLNLSVKGKTTNVELSKTM